ncbi:MAG: metallophosphoesterase family protein [Dysgonamonadaceae bacterium]
MILRFNLILVLFSLIACNPTLKHEDASVKYVMDNIITELYETHTEKGLQSLSNEQVYGLFSEEEREVLATKHWTFNANVPVVVSVIRSIKQETTPFWLIENSFAKTDISMSNEMSSYEIWQKHFDAGKVGLGINGFENFGLHYFVSVAPQNKGDELILSSFFPENQYVGTMQDGAFTYHDWDELVLYDVPEELKGQKLLTTIRGRGVESHLVNAFRKTEYPSSANPDQVMLTWSADPKTSMDIQWRTNTSVESGALYFREKGGNEVVKEHAEKYLMEDLRLMNDRFIHRFTAHLSNLKPGTTYEYSIGSDDKWNKKHSFTTAKDSESFSFIWFGDTHFSPKWGELANMAFKNHPDAAFYSIAGDLVSDGLYRDQWDDLWAYSKDVISQRPFMNVPGNHDNRGGLGALMYREMFSYPKNAPEGVPLEQTYSFNYKNALFLMIDATSNTELQTNWIEQQLKNSTATWKFAIFHFPPYNFEEPYLDIQEEWVPLFDKYHVDMVFGGHIHYYMRSNPMKGGVVQPSFKDGTVYVISIGIPSRDRPIGEEPYAAVRSADGQFYQYLKIDKNRLSYSAIDSGNQPIDSFTIIKPNVQ